MNYEILFSFLRFSIDNESALLYDTAFFKKQLNANRHPAVSVRRFFIILTN